jgi:NADH-quinone oxidoreductase subunit N
MILTKKTTHLTNLKGLGHNHPTLAFILSITMFSLSGIPPLAGFFVKFEIFRSIIMEGQYYLAFLLFLLTVISFFYYLRIIKIIYFENTSKFYKSKDLNESKLRIVSILFHIIVAYVLFIQEPLLNIIEIILTKTFVKI